MLQLESADNDYSFLINRKKIEIWTFLEQTVQSKNNISIYTMHETFHENLTLIQYKGSENWLMEWFNRVKNLLKSVRKPSE